MSDFNHDFKEYNDLSLSDEVQSFEMSIAYEGFDSEAIRKIIRDKKSWSKTKHEDISMLVLLGVYRGNNVDKMVKSMSSQGSESVIAIRNHYNIKNRVGSDKKALTLSRIILTFPWMACQVVKDKMVSQVNMSHLGNFPYVMMTPAFASMIPIFSDQQNLTEILAELHCCYQTELSKLIGKVESKNKQEMFSDSLKYVTLGVRGSKVPNNNRIEKLIEWDIIYYDKKSKTYSLSDDLVLILDKIPSFYH